MATKVKSLDHTRFVVTCTGVSSQARTMYFNGGRNLGRKIGDWSTELGGAKVYDDLTKARTTMRELKDHYTKVALSVGEQVKFDVKVVSKKALMVAKLSYEPEEIE